MNPGPFAHFRSEGSILINGQPLSRQNSEVVSYVAQEDDYHLPALTVCTKALVGVVYANIFLR